MNKVIVVQDVYSPLEPEVYPNLKTACEIKKDWSYHSLRNRSLPCIYKQRYRIGREEVIRVEKPKE